jgi:IMP dehydrogenase
VREYFTFDDVLIRPAYSEVDSREEISTEQEFLGIPMSIPVISANMDYITGDAMASAMHHEGGLGILHRFAPWADQKANIEKIYTNTGIVAFSVGTRFPTQSIDRIKEVSDMLNGRYPQARIVCVDVAHGHHKKVMDLIGQIKSQFPEFRVIAGNVATAEGTSDLVAAGADAIKIGIGPGSVCTTRIVTGVGVPQLSAIIECSNFARPRNIPIIADGGIRSAGDIVKALAAGADVVMLGSLLAGTEEAPGEVIDTGRGRRVKRYQGQSIFGTNDALFTREGISGFVDAKGPVTSVLKQLMGGLRSGMSYVGAFTLAELRQNTEFIRVSHSTTVENHPRVSEYI